MIEQVKPERSLPELVDWAKQEQLELSLSNERLAFLIAVSAMAKDEQTQEFVITSYSIHYTKLYENDVMTNTIFQITVHHNVELNFLFGLFIPFR